MSENPRLDVRRSLLRRGWTEDRNFLLRKGAATLYCGAPDVFLSGPARGRPDDEATVDFPSDTPAPVIVGAAEAWAERDR